MQRKPNRWLQGFLKTATLLLAVAQGKAWSVALTSTPGIDRCPQWSQDNQWVFYIGKHREGKGIFRISAEGGNPQPLTQLSRRRRHLRCSPDGRWLCYTGESLAGQFRLFNLSSQGGTELRLVSEECNQYHPEWSPDGQWIVYQAVDREGTSNLWKISSMGGDPLPITHGDGQRWDPVWSPDGHWIAYVGEDSDGFAQIFKIKQDGSEEMLLTYTRCHHREPAWSPDGRSLVYVEQEGPGSTSLFVVPAEGGQSVRIPGQGEVFEGNYNECPSWSPDGQWIAFQKKCSLCFIPADGGEFRTVRTEPSHGWDRKYISPVWSKDGTHLLCSSGQGNTWSIQKVPTELSPMTPRPGEENQIQEPSSPTIDCPCSSELAWSPDGREFACQTSGDAQGKTDMVLASRLTGKVKQLQTGQADRLPNVGEFVWSPNGEWIACSSQTFFYPWKFSWILLIQKNMGKIFAVTSSREQCRRPAWSPNGKRLAFEKTDEEGFWQIYTLELPDDSSWSCYLDHGIWRPIEKIEQHGLTREPRQHFVPQWSPDEQWIACTDGTHIYKIGVHDGKEILLTQGDTPRFWPVWSPDGKTIACVRGEQIVQIDASGGQERPLTSGQGFVKRPVFSPDGRWLAYTRFVQASGGWCSQLFAVSTQGKGEIQVTHELCDHDKPHWSMDGKTLFYWQNAPECVGEAEVPS